MHISCHIARGWNKVLGSLLTCHKSLSWHFEDVGLTHPLLRYLSIYKKREGSENATQRWEAKEIVTASWGQAIIVFGKLSPKVSWYISYCIKRRVNWKISKKSSVPGIKFPSRRNIYCILCFKTSYLWPQQSYVDDRATKQLSQKWRFKRIHQIWWIKMEM